MSGRTEGGAKAPTSAERKTFPFRAARFGNVTVALAPDRGRSADRRADYHDPTLPPRHALVAFGLWLRKSARLPCARPCRRARHAGMAARQDGGAERETAFPRSSPARCRSSIPSSSRNPGEAAQAKRRIAAVTLGHLPPPLAGAGLDERRSRSWSGWSTNTRRPTGSTAAAATGWRKLIVETAQRDRPRRARPASPATDAPDEALRRIDAWLCDLKDFAIKDGLHVYGRARRTTPIRMRTASAEAERGGAARRARRPPRRGRARPARRRAAARDVLPTGRNLFTADPRTMPTPTAFELGQRGGRRGDAPLSCRTMATGRARWSSTSGAAPRCAPAARRSRKAWR